MAHSNKRTTTTQYARALIQPTTVDIETREVDVVFATETPVPRFGWDEDFNEVLVCETTAVRMDRANRGLPVMDCHNTYSVFNQLGRSIKVWIDEQKQLCARIKFSGRAQVAALFQDIQDGIVKDISVGYDVYKFERVEQPGGANPTYRATDWMPTEISFAPVQADINSAVRDNKTQHTVEVITINNTKNMKNKGKRKAEPGKITQYTVEGEAVKAGDVVTVGDTKGVALSDGEVGDTIDLSMIEIEAPAAGTEGGEGGDDSGEGRAEGDDADGDDEPDGEAGARSRMASIRCATRAAGFPDSYAIELFESGKPADECRQLVLGRLAKNQPKPSGTHSVNVGVEAIDKKREAVQSALLHRVMPQKFEIKEGAREFRGMTLVEMGKELLHERGISVRGLSKMEVADRIFTRSHSTGDFPLLFEGVIDKMLRAQYEFMQEFWTKIARQTTVADFRAKGIYTASTLNGMKKVAEGGEVKYTTLKEAKDTIRVESYAEGISLTRQAFINDDLSAFAIIPSSFVRDWDILRGDIVWGLLTNNVKMGDGKTLFCAEHNNLLTGAASVLSETSLSAAKVSMMKQTDIAGKAIRIMPTSLIVPPELETTARKLVTATTPANTSDVNVFANQFDIIVEPRLTNAKEWYLSADANAVDSLHYAYLEGNESLRVNSEEDFNTDAMKYAVRGDFGAAAIDHRGLVKSNGK